MDPLQNVIRSVGNGYSNLQPPPVIQAVDCHNMNTSSNFSNDSVMYNNTFPSHHVTDASTSQFYPMSYTSPPQPQYVHQHQRASSSPQYISPPIVSQSEFEISGFKIKI